MARIQGLFLLSPLGLLPGKEFRFLSEVSEWGQSLLGGRLGLGPLLKAGGDVYFAGLALRGRVNGCSRLSIKTQPRGSDATGTGC